MRVKWWLYSGSRDLPGPEDTSATIPGVPQEVVPELASLGLPPYTLRFHPLDAYDYMIVVALTSRGNVLLIFSSVMGMKKYSLGRHGRNATKAST